MRSRTALILVVLTPALLITSCKSSTKTKVVEPSLKVSATPIAPASTAPAPSSSAPVTSTPLPPLPPATSAPASSSAPASPTPTPTPTASAPASPSPSASPTNLDPCQLVTQDEASTLAGATFGPGKEETTPGGGKECVYGAQTTNVMDIIVAQATDSATAQADWATEQAQAQTLIATRLPAGVHVNLDTSNVADIGDKAATVTGSTAILGKPISFTAIYVVSGATFFTIGDLVLGTTPPTVAAVQDQARVTLGRI
jgi:hypothetical protein